jgi:hypothetical protein
MGKMWVETARRSAPETIDVWQECAVLDEKVAALHDDRILSIEQYAGAVEYLVANCKMKADLKRAQHLGR